MTSTRAELQALVECLKESERLGIVDYSKETAVRLSRCLPALSSLLEQGEAGEPIAWRVHRDTDYESREYFHTEAEAIENSKLGVVDSHITPLYTRPGAEWQPIDVLLFCPKCGTQHVDAPEPENGWTNPPHRRHLCHACKTVWLAALVPTNGVASISAPGGKRE